MPPPHPTSTIFNPSKGLAENGSFLTPKVASKYPGKKNKRTENHMKNKTSTPCLVSKMSIEMEPTLYMPI